MKPLGMTALFLALGAALAWAAPGLAPVHRLASHAFDQAAPLSQRLGVVPPVFLKHLQDLDENPAYAVHELTPGQRQMLEDYFALLPPLIIQTFRQRLVGLGFIKGLAGSGFTEYILDEGGRVFCVIALNPVVLEQGLSAWLTARERTIFAAAPGGPTVRVEAGERFTGLMGILLHEGAHAADYVHRLTPFVEPAMRELTGQADSAFTRGVWRGYRQPEPGADFPNRRRITLYGFGGGPLLGLDEAAATYEQLSGSPFVSLYGATTWAEDLAEALTFHHLTARLGQPYRIRLERQDKEPLLFEPLAGEGVRARLQNLEVFYAREF